MPPIIWGVTPNTWGAGQIRPAGQPFLFFKIWLRRTRAIGMSNYNSYKQLCFWCNEYLQFRRFLFYIYREREREREIQIYLLARQSKLAGKQGNNFSSTTGERCSRM